MALADVRGVWSTIESVSIEVCVPYIDCILGIGTMDDGADTVAAETPVSCSASSGFTGTTTAGVRTT